MRWFVDTNVILDVLAQRGEAAIASAEILTLIRTGPHEGFVAAHTFPTLHYLLRKHVGSQKAVTTLIDLVHVLQVAPMDHRLVTEALALPWKDFEDALQVVCALAVDAEVFVTRNRRDFLASPILVLEPEELLARLRSGALPGEEWRPVFKAEQPDPEDEFPPEMDPKRSAPEPE
jgi:predicted nucleic acid-binding protein